MSKEVIREEDKWKVDEAVRTLIEYQKLQKDNELKAKAIKELKKREKEIKETLKDTK
jgi:predicted RNA binding protein with dsRBD fold (UPF0201 family)